MTFLRYIQDLKVGDRVVETDKSSCLRGLFGTVYISTSGGGLCVRWDSRKGGPGPMGTSITGGTRKLEDMAVTLDADPKCTRCKITMGPGTALENTPNSHEDFGRDAGSDGCTVTMDGPAQVIDCYKCPQCGHSIKLA